MVRTAGVAQAHADENAEDGAGGGGSGMGRSGAGTGRRWVRAW